MFLYTTLKNLFAAAYIGIFSYPGDTAPEPAQIAELEQARPAVSGENGYTALFELPLTNKNWPEALPRCKQDAPRDCLAFAREHLATYREVAPRMQQAWQAQEQAVEKLRRYSYFRPSAEQLGIGSPTPPYQPLFMQQDLNAPTASSRVSRNKRCRVPAAMPTLPCA